MRALAMVMTVAAFATLASTASDDFGDLETMDVEQLLNDPGAWNAVYECLMDKAPCGDLQKLRAVFPQVIETRCEQCTPKQKEKLEQVIKIVAVKYPKEFQDLSDRYKPKND